MCTELYLLWDSVGGSLFKATGKQTEACEYCELGECVRTGWLQQVVSELRLAVLAGF